VDAFLFAAGIGGKTVANLAPIDDKPA